MKTLVVASLLAAVLAAADLAAARDLPEFLHVCKRNDPNVEACIKESVEHLRPHLVKGEPEYNIPSLEPLQLGELIAAQTAGIRVMAKDIKVYGASNFEVTDLKADLDRLVFNVDVALPNIFVQGMYEIDGKVLLLPIQGSGPMTGNFTDCKGAVQFVGRLDDANGEKYLKINDFKMKIAVGKGTMQLDNLFGGERALGDAVNSAINSNFDGFLRELQPIVEQALADAFLEIGNSIVAQFTYEQLFPEA